MKFRSKVALAVALLFAAPLFAHEEPSRLANTITVSGLGRVRVTPDRVVFNVGVETEASAVEAAVRENNERTARVIAALKGAGAKDSEIQTSNFSINPQYEYIENRRPRIVGYQATNSVTVTRQKIDDAGRLLQAAVTAGVNQASGLSYTVSDPAAGREEGLKKAFADARAKAQVLATASGRTLGNAIAIAEASSAGFTPPPMPMRMAMEAKVAQDVPVQSGEEEVVFQVSVTFELK
jgi:uncharacterized protein YggE